MTIVPTSYFPSIEYFSHLLSDETVLVEACENYVKQTSRNRCHIMTAAGVRALTVPVIWSASAGTPIRDVRIDYCQAWQRTHWRTVRSAYARSPYWEHLEGELQGLFTMRHTFLFDMNTEITERLLEILGRQRKLELTTEYLNTGDLQTGVVDLRYCKKDLKSTDLRFNSPTYYQVFGDRVEFAPNLSILDYMLCDFPGASKL